VPLRHTRLLLAAILACCASFSATVADAAAPAVRLHATFTPERLGGETTIGFGFQVSTPAGETPSPVTEMDLRYPADLGIGLSGLGLQTCSPLTLEIIGGVGCPVESRMGHGTAIAVIPLTEDPLYETAQVTIFRAPTEDGHIALLFFANGESPVSAQIPLPGLLLDSAPPFGGRIHLNIPLVPSLPSAPNVAMVRLQSTIGPRGITYFEHIHGRTVAYKPKGILLPDRCPAGGFPFAASLSFENGSSASASTRVPCPVHRRKNARGRSHT
jgi:hypothetical protein